MAIFVPRFLRQLRDVEITAPADTEALTYDSATGKWKNAAGGGGGGGAPTTADYLVGTAQAGLSAEIVAGTSPGGELSGTWATPTVDAVHSGSSHAATQAAAEASAVILAPASSARNVIQPTAGAVIAAIVKAHAAQSVDLMQWQKSDGTVWGSVGPSGAFRIAPSADVAALVVKPFAGGTGAAFSLSFRNAADTKTLVSVHPTGQVFVESEHPTTSLFYGKAAPGQTDPILVLTDDAYGNLFEVSPSGEVIAVGGARIAYGWGVTAAGYEVLWHTAAAPADGAIAAGELFSWFEGTDGAPKHRRKGKTLDGTVFEILPYVVGGTDVAVADGGTGASTAAGARTNLDVPSNAEAVLDTIFAAKGDLITATANDSPAILTIGTDTHVLTADSAQANGIKWAAAAGGGAVATDAIWDAKGDLAVGTGADTAARLAVGADGTSPVADANSSEGMLWAKRYGQPTYISGGYYGAGGNGQAAAGGWFLDQLYCMPIFIGRRTAFDRIGARLGAGTATLVVRLGIYNDNNGPSGAPVLDAGTVDGATASADKVIVIDQTLDPGLYWLAGIPQVAGTIGAGFVAVRASVTPYFPLAWGGSSAGNLLSPPRCWTRNFAPSGALPTITPVLTDFHSGVEGLNVMLRAT